MKSLLFANELNSQYKDDRLWSFFELFYCSLLDYLSVYYMFLLDIFQFHLSNQSIIIQTDIILPTISHNFHAPKEIKVIISQICEFDLGSSFDAFFSLPANHQFIRRGCQIINRLLILFEKKNDHIPQKLESVTWIFQLSLSHKRIDFFYLAECEKVCQTFCFSSSYKWTPVFHNSYVVIVELFVLNKEGKLIDNCY